MSDAAILVVVWAAGIVAALALGVGVGLGLGPVLRRRRKADTRPVEPPPWETLP